MSRRGARSAPARPPRAEQVRGRARAAAPPLPLRHPALLLALLACAALVALSVTYEAFDPDQWQHLTVGRFIWEQHRFPTVQLWTWPTWGAPEVDYAWLFEAMLWPLWKAFGVLGLFLWRWGTTLAAFALAGVAARRAGARGLAPLVVIALCAMVYRGRSQARPETVAAVLLAAEVALLEARRHGARVHVAWLVPIAWLWANTHISYYLFFLVLGIHVVAGHLAARGRPDAPPARALAWAGLAAGAISFVNPSGWRTLWQPFEFWLVWRHEPIYRTIAEMRPVEWSVNWLNGLPLLLVLWPVLLVVRARRAGLDPVELLTCGLATGTLLVGQRFMGVYALLAAVYLGRDLDAWVAARAWPDWTRGAWTRAGLAVLGCAAVAWPEMSRPYYPVRVAVGHHQPVAAADFIQRHDVHGRMYNPFGIGGYLCFRFWPRVDQLPFMAIHQEGTLEIRRLAVMAQRSAQAWRRLDERFGFDYLVLMRPGDTPDDFLGRLDRDSAWARVFGDDVAYVYVRTRGPFARLAADSAYRLLPADPGGLPDFGHRTTTDSLLRRRAEAELRREVASSPRHVRALGLLANIAMFEGRWDDARRDLGEALGLDPFALEAREKLGVIALAQGRPREALRLFEDERRLVGYRHGLELRRGQVAQALGDLRGARAHYERELRRFPATTEARDSLASLARRPGR